MPQLLEEAISKVQRLSAAEQDTITQLILDELEDEQHWDETFARSQATLGRLAAQAHADIQAGKTKPIGMDDL